MLMILARLVRSESFWAVVKVRSPHNRPEVWYPRHASLSSTPLVPRGASASRREDTALAAVAQRRAQPAGGTSPSDMVPYLRMLVVGDIRARSYATGQQSLGDETTDLARRSDTECCSTLRHRRVPRAALNLAEYTSRYHHASRRSGCLICRKTPTSLLLEESFR